MSLAKTLTTVAVRVGRVLSAHAPEILMATGTVCVAAGTVVTAVQTTKLDNELYEIQEAQNDLKRHKEEFPSKHEYNKELFQIKKAAALRVAKIYAGSTLLVTGGVVCFFAAFGIMKKRQAVLVASLAAVEKAFEEYRARVIEDQGADKDMEYYYGLKKTQVTKEITDEKGKTKTVTEEGYIQDRPAVSRYAVRFTPEFSTEASDDVVWNKNFIKSLESTLNAMLPSQKNIWLDYVYDQMGIDITAESRRVLWHWDKHSPCGKIQLKTIEIIEPDVNDPLGWHKEIIVDFNVDGELIDILPKNPQALGMEVDDHISSAERISTLG